MKQNFWKRFFKVWFALLAVTYFAVQGVEIFYPDINFHEVTIKTEEMRIYGIDRMEMENGVVITKQLGGYVISDPKTKILNALNTTLFMSLFIGSTFIVVIVIDTLKEKWKNAL